MIYSKSSAVLHINKLSILLLSILLSILWFNFELSKTNDAQYTSNTNPNDSSYVKTLTVNPFLHSHDEVLPKDILPKITTLQTSVPVFSDIQLKLHGIVFQQNQNSYAMISMRGAIQEIYRVNGQISEGLFLTSITEKFIEVDYFGERYSLGIENRLVNEVSENRYEFTNEQTTQLSFNQQIEFLEVDKKRNPIRLFMIRRPYAVYSNGEFQGYKIMSGSNEDQFKRLGFEDGDIITYLNGEEFTGPGMKEFVIQQLTHAMYIDLTVLRGDQKISIHYGF